MGRAVPNDRWSVPAHAVAATVQGRKNCLFAGVWTLKGLCVDIGDCRPFNSTQTQIWRFFCRESWELFE